MRLLALGVGCVLASSGCGLTLDYSPPDDASIGFDASRRVDGGSVEDCTEDSECDDGDVCDGVEVCVEGRCVGGTELECEDGFDCTDDRCDADQGCQRAALDDRCDDDGIECTVERCDPAAGCQRELSHDACDDGIFCTIDSCDPAEGCAHVPANARCGGGTCDPIDGCVGTECETDGECFRGPCDAEVRCEAGRCARVPMADGRACEDGNPCTPSTACLAGECRGAESPTCPGSPCVRCNPAGGGCDGSILAPSGTSCEDGDLCTSGDACDAAGACAASEIRACISPGACRASVCNPSTGVCETGATTGGCDDGNPCTAGDSCVSGTCMPGSPMTCPADGDPCTSDACVATPVGGGATGCIYPRLAAGVACDDGDRCTITSACGSDGVCRGASAACPPSSNPCVVTACDPASGACTMSEIVGATCALNATCSGGACTCRPGFTSCGPDLDCECDTSTHVCGSTTDGRRTCVLRGTCPVCAAGESCCPCTGACFEGGCVSCCPCGTGG